MTCRVSAALVWRIILLPLALLFSGNYCLAQTLSLFANTAPANLVATYTGATTLGVKFWSTQAGTISAIKFYRGSTSPQGYVASLYSASGTLLGSVQMATESGPVPGWQYAAFTTPISIAANTTYVAAYYTPSGQYADTFSGLTQSVSNGPLIAPAAKLVGGNGVYGRNSGFPTLGYEQTNFFVDVEFVPNGRYLKLTVDPPNPTLPSTTPLGATVAHITATWSDGAPFTGKLSFGAPNFGSGVYALDSNNNIIVDPLGPGLGAAEGSAKYFTIVAAQ